jgi:DMSO/TMAO reductase YedYZ molybdopterin-dependent catalytic subunit
MATAASTAGRSRAREAAGGVLAAAVAVGTAELVAGLVGVTSVVVSLGEAIIELTPQVITEFVISSLGGLDRGLLLGSVLVVVALVSPAIGILAGRRFGAGAAAVAVLGLLAAAASVANPVEGPVVSAVPGLAAIPAGVAALWAVIVRPRRVGDQAAVRAGVDAEPLGRRAFLTAAASLVVVAGAAAAGGRWLQERTSAARERLELALPSADRPAPAPPAGADFELDGLEPHLTPNDRFYRIDTAARVPNLRADEWQLRIHGMVDEEVTLTYADLLERELVEEDITLVCVSNRVGGELIGNARWLGVRLDDLLAEVGIDPRATQLVGRSIDGFTAGFPVADATDGRDALLAIGMNGEPLPVEHGYPVRLVVPGLYGYVSAVKWLAELEFTTFDAFDAYWVRRNWAAQAPVKTQSRIDRPAHEGTIEAGTYTVAGIAWAQPRGVERVEVQVDDGDWREAELADVGGDTDTWRQWRVDWDAEPGAHRIRVRATDGEGVTQSEDRVEPIPDGAEGWHTVEVAVTA